MYKYILIVMLFLGSFIWGQNERQKIRDIRYKRKLHLLEFFKKEHYDKANKQLPKFKNLYEKMKEKYELEMSSKKKKKIKKKLDKLKENFEIFARIVRFYEYSLKRAQAEYKGDFKKSNEYGSKISLARLEYEEYSGRIFSDLYNNYKKARVIK